MSFLHRSEFRASKVTGFFGSALESLSFAALAILAGLAASAGAEIPFERHILDDDAYGHRVIADIDGDGRADIAAVDFSGGHGEVVWYRFPEWTRFVVVRVSGYADYAYYRSDDLKYADIDGDGDEDLVGRVGHNNDGPGLTCWWENPLPSGDPTAEGWTRHDIGESDYGKDIGVADYNLDGRLDVAVRENAESHVFVQNAGGAWSHVMATSHHDHEGMAIGDLDMDGDADLVLNGFWLQNPHPGPLTDPWVERNIDSKWWNQSGHGWQDNNSNIDVGDLDGDGRPDVAISQSELPGYPLSWYSADDPVNGPWTEHVVEAVYDYCQTVQVTDFDNDGVMDILAAEFPRYDAPHPVVVYRNLGAGLAWDKQTLADTGIYHGQAGDVGSDGDIDIVGTRNYNAPPLEMWENLSGPSTGLEDWTYIEVDDSRAKWGDWDEPNWSKYFGLAMGDLTGDGFADIASGRYFYRNPGGGMTGHWPRVDFGLNCDANLITDVDGDSLGDVIASAGDKVYWLEAADAAGAAWNVTVIDSAFPKPDHGNPQGYMTAQILAGGRKEVLLHANGVYCYEIPADPGAGAWPRVRIAHNSNGEGIGVGDINGDGRIDIAVADQPPGWSSGEPRSIKWLANPGDGSGDWPEYPIGTIDADYPDRVSVADLNGDGRPDILVTEEAQPVEPNWKTYWFEAPADPTQGGWTRHILVTQHTTNSMDVADMDGDGDMDVILGEHRGTEKLSIWENDGLGGFTEHVIDSGKESHLGARVADLDADGDREILSICWDDYPYLHLWRNDNAPLPPSEHNRPPTVYAGADATLNAGEFALTLNGVVRDDGRPTTGALASWWSRASGPGAVTFDDPAAAVTTARFSGVPGTYVLRLSASDGDLSSHDDLTVQALEEGADVVLWWAFNDGAGETARDVGFFGNDGAVHGPEWMDGRLGGALLFDGEHDYVARPDASLDGAVPCRSSGGATAFTVSAWIRRDETGARHPIVSKQGTTVGGAARGFVLEVTGDNQLKLEIFKNDDSDHGRSEVHSAGHIGAGAWRHVAFTYEYLGDGSSRARLFIDGAPDGENAAAVGPPQANPQAFEVGRYYWSDAYHVFWPGAIDDVRVYSRVLSDEEIALLATGAVPRRGVLLY